MLPFCIMATKRSFTAAETEHELYMESDSEENVEESDDDSEEERDEEHSKDEGSNDKHWTVPQGHRFPSVYVFTADSWGLKTDRAPHVSQDSTPLTVFKLLFHDKVVQLLVEETNRYYHKYIDTFDKGPSPQPDMTEQELYLFLAIIIQMGHDNKDTLKDYWSTAEQFHTPFYSNTMKRDRFFHILRYLHFCNNEDEPDKDDKNYDRLWKMRDLFDMLNDSYVKYYNPSEYLAVDEVNMLFKGRIAFKQYISNKRKCFGIKIYKLCDNAGYTYDMKVYSGKDRQNSAHTMTATHATVRSLIRRVKGFGHKLYMDNFFSSPDLFDDLHTQTINCCGTIRPNRKGMPKNFDRKSLRLKRGDLRARAQGDLTAICWKDKREVYILTNSHFPPAEGNFIDRSGNALKPAIVEDYNRHMGYVDKRDRMANRYSISRRTWKWTKKLFFHLVDLTIINSWILLRSCGNRLSHRDFRLALVRNLLHIGSEHQPQGETTGRENLRHSQHWRVKGKRVRCRNLLHIGSESQPQGKSAGRESPSITKVSRLEVRHSQHWPVKGKRVRCRVCSAQKLRTATAIHCKKCEVGLCLGSCFMAYHTKQSL